MDLLLIFDPRWAHFEARFSKKHVLKIDAKIIDFLGGSGKCDVGGPGPRQGVLLTT